MAHHCPHDQDFEPSGRSGEIQCDLKCILREAATVDVRADDRADIDGAPATELFF
jgi:hypothetical protein